jgi:serine/threonine protein kinase
MDYEQGLDQLKSALREGDQEAFLTFTTFEARLRANLADEHLYGYDAALRHERSRIIDELNRLAIQCLGVDFVGLCLPPQPSVPQRPPIPGDQPWRGGAEINVLGKVYLLHDPVNETQAPDRSYVRRRAKAWQPDTNRKVWLKQVRVGRTNPSAKKAWDMLKREGQLLTCLENRSDAHFPRLLDLEANEGSVTLVYTIVSERTLAQVFGPLDKPLDAARALRLLRSMRSLCDMLGVLHREKLSHRHLSPEDIVLLQGQRDWAALQDLGLATQPPVPDEGPSLYRAPEQVRLDRLTLPGPRTDIYQLGAVLYHFLAGRPPTAFLAGVEPPSTWNRSLPPELDDAILKALAEDPGDRWPGIGDFDNALHRAANQLQNLLRGEG